MQALERRQELLLDGDRRRQLERRRDGVVRALAAVDVVVRVDLPAVAEARRREMGDDLVHVRVGRGARTGLVDIDRELVVVVAVRHRRGSGRDGARDIRIEQAELAVRLRGGELDEGQRSQESARHALARDREVQDRPLGRRAVQRADRDVHLAHRIALDAGRCSVGLVHGAIVGRGPAVEARPGR